jgi:hypothetical protein
MMTDCTQESYCAMGMVYEEKFARFASELAELKGRIEKVETTLSRAVTLLVANLAGIIVILLETFVKR